MADPETSKDKPAESDVATAGVVEDAPAEDVESTEAPGSEAPADEPSETPPETRPAPAEPAPPIEERRSSGRGAFLGTVLGGIVAAAIGFGFSQYLGPTGWPFGSGTKATDALAQRIDSNESTLSGLKDQIAELSKATNSAQAQASDASGLSGRVDKIDAEIADLKSSINKSQNALQQSISGLGDRVTALEKLPLTGSGSGASADSAVLGSLRAQLEEQRKQNASLAAEIKSVGEKANARIDQAEKQAQTLKAQADTTAKSALARSALTRVQAALNLGGPFASSLDVLSSQGVQVPSELADAATNGVPTETELQRSFPAAARSALQASIKATMGNGFGSRLSAFLRAQTGLRSLKPRQGSGPDAVLSRAQADVGDGKLSDALKEISTLPDAGQKAMAGWVEKAKTRLDALHAAGSLAQSIGN